MGGTGLEPATFPMSTGCAKPTAPTAQGRANISQNIGNASIYAVGDLYSDKNLYLGRNLNQAMSQHLQQQEPEPRYGKIDPQLFINNRARLAAMLPPGALVILHSADIMPKSGDGQLPFKQDSDFFYLTGIDQEEGILVLFPNAKIKGQREMLFTKRTDAKIAIWEGPSIVKRVPRPAQVLRMCNGLLPLTRHSTSLWARQSMSTWPATSTHVRW